MKKPLLLLLLTLCVTLLFVSCAGIVRPAGVLRFVVTNWNSGPGVVGATVEVYESGTANRVGHGVTGALGAVEINVSPLPAKIDVKVTKQGFARSLVQGLKPEAIGETPFGIIMKTATLNPDPATETDPVVQIGFFEIETGIGDERAGIPIDISVQPITGPFTAKIKVTAFHHIACIYAPHIGRIPGDSDVTFDQERVENDTEAEFDITPIGHDGEVALYTAVYDYNGNRTLKVDYLRVNATDPEEVAMYQPMTLSELAYRYFNGDFALENIWTYTRRSGKKLDVDPREAQILGKTEPLHPSERIESRWGSDPNEGSRVAPENGNLWSHLFWTDWHTAYQRHLDDPRKFPNPGDEPDGYNLYYSLDSVNYAKLGFVTETSVAEFCELILFFIGIDFDVNPVMNSFALYKDPSIFLHPGVRMHYRLTSVYGTLESTPTYLGSVVPLDSFNIELENPVDDEVDVSLNPVLKWKPTKALESLEGDVTYTYAPFIYDWAQSGNGLIFPITLAGKLALFTSDSADSIELPFTGANPSDPNIGWTWYNPYSDTNKFVPYDEDTLEPYKTYNWGVNIAFACVKDTDSRAYSIAADYKIPYYGWGFDPIGCMEPDLHAAFTTGAQ